MSTPTLDAFAAALATVEDQATRNALLALAAVVHEGFGLLADIDESTD